MLYRDEKMTVKTLTGTTEVSELDILKACDNILQQHSYLKRTGEGMFHCEMYIDPRDELTEEQALKVAYANSYDEAIDMLVIELENHVYDTEEAEQQEITRILEKHWSPEELGDFNDSDVMDCVSDFISEHITFGFDFAHYLKTELLVNLTIDAGDSNQDYTTTKLFEYVEEDEDGENTIMLPEDSGLVWLVKQQGYTVDQLEEAVLLYLDGEEIESDFLRSVIEEVHNTTTYMNAVTFPVKMTVRELIEWEEHKMTLVVDTSVEAGLVDFWLGAGGALEIQLENKVVLPYEIVKPMIDQEAPYGIQSIYGMGSDFWTTKWARK